MNLTPRELSVLECISEGMSIDQTADALCISRSTVEKALQSARVRLNAKTMIHAVVIAVRLGLICVVLVVTTFGSSDIQRSRTRRSRREMTTIIQLPQGVI